jgi:hypothetical protein
LKECPLVPISLTFQGKIAIPTSSIGCLNSNM